jgi:hypothetical protein
MMTAQQYRDRAKEARVMAEAIGNPKSRRLWLETAQAFEKLAGDLPAEDALQVERVEQKK